MAEKLLSDSEALALGGTTDADMGAVYPNLDDDPWFDPRTRLDAQLIKCLLPANNMRVYRDDADNTTIGVRGGSFKIGGAARYYNGATFGSLANNDTSYVWAYDNSGTGAVAVGTAWPGYAHIPLAEVTVASGAITTILDRRPESMLTDGGAAGGAVTSVALDVSALTWLTNSGGPITSTGTFTVGLATGQTANQVLATPDGSTGSVGLRALVAGDIPNLSGAKITSGTLSNTVQDNITRTGTLVSGTLDATTYLITNIPAPTNAGDPANKSYVDATVQGLQPKPTADVATAAALPANTYNNGTAGLGATLTGNANGALSVDGVTVTAGWKVLVLNESSASHNGLYDVTTVGDGSNPYVLTRNANMDTTLEYAGGFVPVANNGTANPKTLWICNPSGAVTVGTTDIPFTQLNAATSMSAGTGITITGNTVSINTAWAGQVAIITVGTISTGVWQGTAVGVAYGGTGATDASTARTNLGLAIGSDVLAYSAILNSIAGLTYAADKFIYFTDATTPAVGTVTAAGRALIDDATAGDQRTTLGLGTAATVNTGTTIGTIALLSTGGKFDAARIPSGVGLGDMLGANNLSELTNAATARTNLGLGTAATAASTDFDAAGAAAAVIAGKLSQFAATSSAELAGVISDETGSGALVFATSPSLTTPNIGAATCSSLTGTFANSSVSIAQVTALGGTHFPAVNPVASDATHTMLQYGGMYLVGVVASSEEPYLYFISSDEVQQGWITQELVSGDLQYESASGLHKFGDTNTDRVVLNGLTGNIQGGTLTIKSTGTGTKLVTIQSTENLAADRAITIVVNDADRTLTFGGNLTTAGAVTFSGAYACTLTLTGTTSVTLPTSGTLATTAQLTAESSKSVTLLNPDGTTDFPFWVGLPAAITITAIKFLCLGGTSWTGSVVETDANGGSGTEVCADVTASAGTLASNGTLTNAGIASGNSLTLRQTSKSGSPTSITITIYFTQP